MQQYIPMTRLISGRWYVCDLVPSQEDETVTTLVAGESLWNQAVAGPFPTDIQAKSWVLRESELHSQHLRILRFPG